MPAEYKFLNRDDYLEVITQLIKQAKAGDRVALGSMELDVHATKVGEILHQLTAAAQRGVNVLLQIDAYSFLVDVNGLRPGPLLYSKNIQGLAVASFQARVAQLESLRQAGGHFVITNTPNRRLSIPLKGRCHLKFAVVNNQLFLGSCNLSGRGLELMVGWVDQVAADWVYNLALRISANPSTVGAFNGQDLSTKLDSTSRLLFDCGVTGQSQILQQALTLIDNAQTEIFLSCQYFPNSLTLQHLRAADERGVKVKIFYNHPSKHGLIYGALHHGVVIREKMRTSKHFFDNQLDRQRPYIHAKLLATEKAAIIGSHNFVTAGVNFGTAEMALINHDPQFAKLAIRNLLDQLSD